MLLLLQRTNLQSRESALGQSRLGRGKLQVQPCPQCPVSGGRPEKGGLSRWATTRQIDSDYSYAIGQIHVSYN